MAVCILAFLRCSYPSASSFADSIIDLELVHIVIHASSILVDAATASGFTGVVGIFPRNTQLVNFSWVVEITEPNTLLFHSTKEERRVVVVFTFTIFEGVDLHRWSRTWEFVKGFGA
jgi:hypothetical protein